METAQEWILEFDLLCNSINSDIAPALDNYEKSVFLTMAQEQVAKTLYSGGALGQDSFESTELLRRSLDSLIKEVLYDSNADGVQSLFGKTYTLPVNNRTKLNDVLYIIYEEVSVTTEDCGKGTLIVVPTTHDVFYKTRNNPFRGANERRALRLDVGKDKVEIVTTLEEYDYLVRYIKVPYPIILLPLTGGDSINGLTEPLEVDSVTNEVTRVCELDESVHRLILSTAVLLALQATMK